MSSVYSLAMAAVLGFGTTSSTLVGAAPIVDPDDMRYRLLLRGMGTHRPQQRVLADRQQEPTRETLPRAATQRETEMADDALQP